MEKIDKTAAYVAGHIVARYVLFGNIDTIESVSVKIDDDEVLVSINEDEGKILTEWRGHWDNISYVLKDRICDLAGDIADYHSMDEEDSLLNVLDWNTHDEYEELRTSFGDEAAWEWANNIVSVAEDFICNNMALICCVEEELACRCGQTLGQDELLYLVKKCAVGIPIYYPEIDM